MRRLLLPLFVVLALIAGACIVSGGALAGARPTPSPTPTTPPPDSGAVGYLGCSNSAAAVDGYHLRGGQLMWPFIRNYGGGTVTNWANGIGVQQNQWWSAFTKQQQLAPATTFWFQLCRLSSENGQNIEAQAIAVIAEVRRRVPNAVVYVSALNDWVAPHVCPICGAGTPAEMQMVADQLVAESVAEPGPHLPALISRYQTPSAGATQANNQTTTDGCHPNTAGKLVLGTPLLNFFG